MSSVTSARSSVSPFDVTCAAAGSTSASSPPTSIANGESTPATTIENEEMDKRYERLEYVLKKSAIYASILQTQMDSHKAKLQQQQEEAVAQKPAQKRKVPRRSAGRKLAKGKKRLRADDSDDDDGEQVGPSNKKPKLDLDAGETAPVMNAFRQPALVTGATLKDYQLDGLQWMVSLDQNGISGILADEMGLGKTLQTIAFCAYLREHKSAPFLVVCPLSVLHNWMDEFAKFAPGIPVVMYHGSPAERAELRRTEMPVSGLKPKPPPAPPKKNKRKAAGKTKPKHNGKPSKPSTKAAASNSKSGPRRSGRFYTVEAESEEEEEDADEEEIHEADSVHEEDATMHASVKASASADVDEPTAIFPVVITTYEMIIKDRVHLAQYNWAYIVVDEGHRLKNMNCKLMQEIKKYTSAGRMILTGTPLHNNLAELWSLLNFILPDIFNDVDSFQEWFNIPAMQTNLGSERSSKIINALHAILKPFLLRRLKVDVASDLPPKKEYVLYAPLTVRQRDLYDSILGGSLRKYLIGNGKVAEESQDIEIILDQVPATGDVPARKSRRKGPRKSYVVHSGSDDDDFDFGGLAETAARATANALEIEELGRDYAIKATLKKVNNMKLQNTVMQLRKVCSHPYLFDWPVDPETRVSTLTADLVDASGKMMVLDRLLTELFARKHKVLLFSQFTTMLDVIEDWACEFKGWKICRIDGSTSPLERREQMNIFQNGGDAPNAPCLFLLSTRAGGLGINLVAADTVIFYDQDWNPQMDAQAQDRAHRIGQTKPVLIFRLVSAHTIETKIMQRANEKRKLEALVIAKGKFKMPASAAPARGKPETMAEMAAALLKLEGEKIEVVPNTAAGKASVLSDADLDLLLDRRSEVFADRGKGWTSATAGGDEEAPSVSAGTKTAFAVYEAPVDEGNEALAKMLGEDTEAEEED